MARDPLDRYYTPEWLTLACWRFLLKGRALPDVALEPCCGGGAFGREALRLGVPIVTGCDPDPEAEPGYPWSTCALKEWRPELPAGRPMVWVVTNPHYTGVYTTVGVMREFQARNNASLLALLLRETAVSTLIEGDDPPHMVALTSKRPVWGGEGGRQYSSGDRCGAALCVWGRDRLDRGAPTLHALDVGPRTRRAVVAPVAGVQGALFGATKKVQKS